MYQQWKACMGKQRYRVPTLNVRLDMSCIGRGHAAREEKMHWFSMKEYVMHFKVLSIGHAMHVIWHAVYEHAMTLVGTRIASVNVIVTVILELTLISVTNGNHGDDNLMIMNCWGNHGGNSDTTIS
jgi:hypothetical protein